MYYRMKDVVINICTLLVCFHVATTEYDECNMENKGTITLIQENAANNDIFVSNVILCWCNGSPNIMEQSNCEWYNVCFDSNHWTVAREVCQRLDLPHSDAYYYYMDRSTTMEALRCNGNFKRCSVQENCPTIGAVICASYSNPRISSQECSGPTTTIVHSASCPTPNPTPSKTSVHQTTLCTSVDPIDEGLMNTGPPPPQCTSLTIVTGLLVAILVVITTGWVCTCVFMKWRTKSFKPHNTGDSHSSQQPQHQLDNPVYDGDIPPPAPPANYSSLGPAYEIVQDNRGAGHSYDIINPNHRRGRSSKTTANNTTSDHDYHVLEHGSHVTGDDEEHDYHVLKSNNSGTEGERGQQDNNVQGGGDGDPLNYEVPTSKTGEDQEEYSKLKH